jgi:hypothetical protein
MAGIQDVKTYYSLLCHLGLQMYDRIFKKTTTLVELQEGILCESISFMKKPLIMQVKA